MREQTKRYPVECLDEKLWLGRRARSELKHSAAKQKMKNMKTCYALLGAATLLAVPNLFASISGTGTIDVNYDWGNQIFNVATTSSSGPSLGDFQTFCLNDEVKVQVPGTYAYTISDSANPGTPATSPAVADPISYGTAWLYSNFREGTLSGYASYTGSTADNILLQQAIWWLEDDSAGLGGAANNIYIQAAEAALGRTDITIKDDANGYGNVFALNLQIIGANGSSVQPLLGMVAPVPEPSTIVAGALLLLPFGVSTLRIMRKNKVQ
jgi:hypothetical protein